jgi:hypothetical protein
MHNLPDLPTLATFAAHLHSTFRLTAATGPALTLSEAAALAPARLEQRQFSLIFQGPLQPALPQATYTLEHRTGRTCHLPGADRRGCRRRAVPGHV